jgi:hypothetical protein
MTKNSPVPQFKPGSYADGLPYHEIGYLEYKLILKPNPFVSRKSLLDFVKVMKAPAEESGVRLSTDGFEKTPLQIREVLFLDTADYKLYKNSFILRRRILYEDGFPEGEPEIVLKYRNSDIQKVAELDLRPKISSGYKVKFKAEYLPLKEGLGGMRPLFSKSVEFSLPFGRATTAPSLEELATTFPGIDFLPKNPEVKTNLVSDTIVEEVLQDIALVDLGGGVQSVANVSLWRARGDHRPLVGEFSFQMKFSQQSEVREKSVKKAQSFFVALQNSAKEWLELGATKTAIVYRLKGNMPNAGE